MDKQILTYSALSNFLRCRMRYKYRYLDKLVPKEKADALRFGSVMHKALEQWHKEDASYLFRGNKSTKIIDDAFLYDPAKRHLWSLASAMLWGYEDRYPTEGFEVIALEKTFELPIINPHSGKSSRTFTINGKVDGIVKQAGEFFVLEHKTTSSLEFGFLEKIWSDFQTRLYAYAIGKEMGVEISGVIYNVLVKAKLKQSEGETEDEYLERYRDLCANNKNGRSTAKQKMPESDEDYVGRLVEKYKDPAMFHREMLYFTNNQMDQLYEQIWELTQQLLDARRRRIHCRNTGACFNYNKACVYLPLCKSNDSPALLFNYEIKEPNSELYE